MASAIDSDLPRGTRRISQPGLSPLKKWFFPLLVAAVVLTAVGWWSHTTVERAIEEDLASELQTTLNANVTALRFWLEMQKDAVNAVIAEPRVRACVRDLVTFAKENGTDADSLRSSKPLACLREVIPPLGRTHGYTDFLIIEPGGINLGALRNDCLGSRTVPDRSDFMTRVLSGKTVVSRPFRSALPQMDTKGMRHDGRPTMFTAAPVRDRHGLIIAILGLRIDPDKDFTRILRLARPGKTGETYTFDSRGLMISQSRFDKHLRQIGLLGSEPEGEAILNVEIRDPGGDMVQGFKPKVPRAEQPLTRMAASAVTGKDGVDVKGYRDYRGVPVIGAWTWISEYGFGVATEEDVAEAYRPLTILRRAFLLLFGLLVIAIAGVLSSSLFILILKARMKNNIQPIQRLGQYALEEKIGRGSLGEVYIARHLLLKRPTVVKLVHPERHRDEDIKRFQREVHLTSRLTHPNTIRIYDYGFTADGIFYYAMEYLYGTQLIDLLEANGPLSEARTIHILLQVCASLKEAHGMGLIHRDIKPENIMLCEPGGIYDFVKVLDFGLIKDTQDKDQAGITNPRFAVGTPRYLPPEAIQSSDQMDARSDLYSLGAVGYFMLTGSELFETDSVMDIIHLHLSAKPKVPSERVDHPVSSDLEGLIMKCLEKDPQDRPQSADEFAQALNKCQDAGKWTEDDARNWWKKFGPRVRVTFQTSTQSEE